MNTLLHRDEDDSPQESLQSNDREITLGPTVILGIFFALALLCAVFFGFGYSMGRKSNVTAVAVAPASAPPSPAFSGFKPAAGNPLGSAETRPAGPVQAPVANAPPGSTPPHPDEKIAETAPSPAATVEEARPLAHSAAAAVALPPVPTGGTTMVQIAAVSHQEDADLLVTTLKRRGYAVSVRSEPQDKLLHVQLGPFPTHKDADAMRLRLLADGFNAIVKEAIK